MTIWIQEFLIVFFLHSSHEQIQEVFGFGGNLLFQSVFLVYLNVYGKYIPPIILLRLRN